jgi:hypothetical protein
MGGLKRLCRLYGRMEFVSQNGKKTVYVWDYAKNEPRIKSEMTKDEIKESEKAKWMGIKNVDIK